MKLSTKEYDAMQSDWRKWINKNIEIKGFRTWGMDFAGKDVLEVGCGSGYSASLICEEDPKSYTGIDIMPEQLEKAEALGLPNATFVQGDVADLSRFEDNSFDVIVDFMILHHVEGWRDFLDEAFRVLRPGGDMFINDLTRKGVHLTDSLVHWGHAEEPLFSTKEFEQQANKSGFITMNKINYAGLDCCFKFRKPAGQETGNMKMSAKYEMLKKLVKAAGIRKRFDMSADEIIEDRRKANAKVSIPKIKDKDFDTGRIYVMGYPVVTMKHREKSGHANLFIIGGGMVSAPRPGAVKKALRFAKETGLDMYVPYYPLCTDNPLTRSYQMIYETYREMLKDYAPENISILGTSSGGNLALGLAAYIHDQGDKIPMPGHIMAISPGTCPATEEEWQRMLELDKIDVAIPASYMKTAETIMRHGDDSVPDYMIFLQKADFTGCPKVTFMYGSDEVLYAVAPSFEEAMKKYGVEYEMIVGEGMFHCYPVFPICREAEEGWDQMVSLMRAARTVTNASA